jgi:hypothetical protein
LESDIYLLQIADGVRDALISGGFSTIKSILESTTSDISNRVGIDQYVAQIVFEEAKKISIEMTKTPTLIGTSIARATAPPTENEKMT